MAKSNPADELNADCRQRFAELVNCVGTKRFATAIGVTPRQVNRILSGAQPNPVERLIRCLQAADPAVGDCVIDYICQELGGHFVRHDTIDTAAVNAVRECAEAIAAISDGQITSLDVREIRDAINALSSLIYALRTSRDSKP